MTARPRTQGTKTNVATPAAQQRFFSRAWSYLGMWACLTLPSCMVGLSADQVTNRVLQQRCTEDGLCMQPVGAKSLEGAFRENGEEVRFDVAYLPFSREPGVQNYAVRMIDQVGEEFYSSHYGYFPRPWRKDKPMVHIVPGEGMECMDRLERRNQMIKKMEAAMMKLPIEQTDASRREGFSLVKELINEYADKIRRCDAGDCFSDTPEDHNAQIHGSLRQESTP